MKRWAILWACLSIVPISFDAYPEPDQTATQRTAPAAGAAGRAGVSDHQSDRARPSNPDELYPQRRGIADR
jgi:hypothetical protein